MDLSQAENIEIVADNRRHRAEFLAAGPSGEYVFKILERDHPHLKTHTGDVCEVTFTTEGRRCFFRGRVSSQSPEQAIVFGPSAVQIERRGEIRQATAAIPARIRSKAFLHTQVVHATILDINHSGARISTTAPLEAGHTCELEATLVIRHAPHPFAAACTVSHCRKGRAFNIAGIRFNEQSLLPEHRRNLEDFLAGA